MIGGLVLKENQNIRFQGGNFSAKNLGGPIIQLSKDHLFQAYGIFKESLREEPDFVPVPLDAGVVVTIKTLETKYALIDNPKRKGSDFTPAEKSLAVDITQKTPKVGGADASAIFMSALCQVFSPGRAKKIPTSILSGDID